MANRYWVGGTGTWNSTAGTKWSTTSGGAGGSAVPTSSDSVYFDANSGAAVVTIGTASCNTLDCNGFTGTIALNADISIGGSTAQVPYSAFRGSSTMTFTSSSYNFSLKFVSTYTSATHTIDPNGAVMPSMKIDATGSYYQLSSAYTGLTSGAFNITLTAGSFDTNNYNITLKGGITITSASGPVIFSMGSSTVTVTSWSSPLGVDLTVNSGTSTIVMATGTTTFSSAGHIYNNIQLQANTQMSGDSTFNEITINSGITLTLVSSPTITVKKIITSTSAYIQTSSGTATIKRSASMISIHNTTLTNIHTDSPTGYYALTTNSNIDGGNNGDWIFNDVTEAELVSKKTYQYRWYTP